MEIDRDIIELAIAQVMAMLLCLLERYLIGSSCHRISMKNLDELKQILSTQKQSLCNRYQLTTLGIFGSYARGEQTEASDVDILVDYEIAPTFVDLVELRDYLSEIFDLKVDVVTKNGLKNRIRDRVLAEIIDI